MNIVNKTPVELQKYKEPSSGKIKNGPRKNLVKLARMVTDRMDLKAGLVPVDESVAEYWMLDAVLDDEMADLALAMGRRKPKTTAEIAKKIGWDESHTQAVLDRLCEVGFVEYNYHNEQHVKKYNVPVFVVGNAENMILNPRLIKEMPDKVGKFQETMSYKPLELIGGMVPPGGAGLGFHVIPVEKAIEKENQSLDIEHLSYWLNKYRDQLAVMPCVCRRSMRILGEGCGELEDEVCIAVGDYADYLIETGKEAKRATYEEIVALLKRAEENGYMHQITNGDGKYDIFAICNCDVGACYGLRCSQLYNNPNLSASAYRARVDTENCVACGKCVEVCPTGAAKLGQKLCTGRGPVEYPMVDLPDEHFYWSKSHWNYNYREDNKINCYDTGTAPCKTACPAHIAVQGYLKMAAEGRYMDALKLIKQDNPFPAVCGSICNRRCEDACTRGTLDQPLAIDEVKRFIALQELHKENRYVPEVHHRSGKTIGFEEKIGIIGAGPGGMSCAYYLAQMGYSVTVFEKNEKPGGMLRYGIPGFVLEKDVLDSEIDVLRQMGIEFRCGINVGTDITLNQLRQEGYKGFLLSIGAQGGRKLGVPGEEADGVVSGVEFLRNAASDNRPDLNGEDTVVIGGGNVAIDVARTAARLNSGKLMMFCLESREEMPAADDEAALAEAENVEIGCSWGPKEILTEDGHVTGIVMKRCTSVKNSEGRFAPQYDENDTVTISCRHVLAAIGQSIEWGTLLDGEKVERNRNQTAKADPVTYQTAEPDLFVIGDAFSGPRFAIDAIAAGKDAAESLHRFVHEGQSLKVARNLHQFRELNKEDIMLKPESYDRPPRQSIRHNKSLALTLHDDRIPFTEEQVKAETSRCLGCGATVVDEKKCIGCGICTTRCNFDAMHLHRTHPNDVDYVSGDDSYFAVAKHAVKRTVRLAADGAEKLLGRT